MGINIETIFIVLFCLIIFFVMVILPIVLTKKYHEEQKKNTREHIRFNTPYCSFLWDDGAEPGYEGEIEWEYNQGTDKNCGLFFETDNPVRPPQEGYTQFAKVRLGYEENNDLEIEKLIKAIPRLEEISPGKCYQKLESIISDKKRIDTEIRQAVADYFWVKKELIVENTTKEQLMEGISISFISVYRNGVIEYGIFDTGDIYVDDLRVVIKEDGNTEILYNPL